MNLFIVILGGFLTSALRRFTAFYRGNNNFESISGILRLSMIYSFVLSILLTFPFLFLSDKLSIFFLNSIDYSKFLFFYSFSIPFTIFSTYLTAYLSGFEKFREVSISTNILPNIFRLLFLLVWWIFLPFREIGITLSLVIKAIISFFLNYYYSRELLNIAKYSPNYEIKKWFKFSIPSFLRYGVSYLTDNIGIIILGSLKDSLSAGVFRGANFIISILWNLNVAFSSVLIPRISYLISQNNEDLALKTLKRFYILNSLLVIISTIVFILFGKNILLMLGSDYTLGYNVLIILSFQVLIGTISSPYEVYMEAKGRTDLSLINYTIYSLSTILFLYIFSKFYSKEGTAFAYLLGILVLSILRVLMFKLISKKGIYFSKL